MQAALLALLLCLLAGTAGPRQLTQSLAAQSPMPQESPAPVQLAPLENVALAEPLAVWAHGALKWVQARARAAWGSAGVHAGGALPLLTGDGTTEEAGAATSVEARGLSLSGVPCH